MIEAIQAMQAAGTTVDPAVLAGGIWTALSATAVGLAVAMSASAVLTWLDPRAAAERRMADLMVETRCAPALPPGMGHPARLRPGWPMPGRRAAPIRRPLSLTSLIDLVFLCVSAESILLNGVPTDGLTLAQDIRALTGPEGPGTGTPVLVSTGPDVTAQRLVDVLALLAGLPVQVLG